MDVSRRTFLIGTGAVGLGLTMAHGPVARAAGPGAPVVADGQPRAIVVVANSRAAQVTAAAELIVTVVRTATGVELPVVTAAEDAQHPAELTRIYAGTYGPRTPDGVWTQARGLDTDGFVVATTADSVTLLGLDKFGAGYACYEFCEKYLGARWLMPGDAGLHVPPATTITVPLERYAAEPVFAMRQFSPLMNPGHTDTLTDPDPVKRWGAIARQHWRIEFHHNLWRLFPPATYGDPSLPTYRPDFYPIHDGETYIPPASRHIQWQPRFQAPGIAEAAAATIVEHLRPRPHLLSYSLGVNDSGGFSEDEVDLTKLNSVGYADASDPYYAFVNEVADRVTRELPYARIGLLAYTNVADPPSFPLHPAVIPFLTRDRFGWVDDKIRAEDQANTLAWQEVANELGWYDYRYGAPYCVPRVDTPIVAESYRWAATHGVRWHYAELYPNWGEGPKPYVLGKLVWQPEQDDEALTQDWYERAVGPAAAGALAEHFAIWQRYWAEVVPHLPWFRNPRMYHYMVDPSYLEGIEPADVIRSRQLLDQVIATAPDGPPRERATVMRRSFAYSEAAALSWPRPGAPLGDLDEAGDAIRAALADVDAAVERAAERLELLAEFQTDPVLKQPLQPVHFKHTWSGWNLYPLWHAADLVRNHPGADRGWLTQWRRYERTGSPRQRQYAAWLGAAGRGRTTQLATNPGFDDPDVAPWQIAYEWKTGELVRPETLGDGTTTLRLPPGFQGSVFQDLTVQPGPFRFSTRLRATATDAARHGYYVVLQCQLLDDSGAVQEQFWSSWFPVVDAMDTWSRVELAEVIPAGVTRARFVLNTQLNAIVHLDEMRVEQLS
ncbi:DUF4838 domain-containing protein [Propionibacteriaceae bacterium Y2011]